MSDSDSNSVSEHELDDVWSDTEFGEDAMEGETQNNVLFAFEPQGDVSGAFVSDDSSDESEESVERMDNTEWCTCGCCEALERNVMCKCCDECHRIQEKKSSCADHINCITDYPGFNAAMLDTLTLDIAYIHFKQEARDRGWGMEGLEKPNRCYRYIAYRQFVRWIYSVLGRHIRVPLPACVVKRIRERFPLEEKNEAFEGFHWPDELHQ